MRGFDSDGRYFVCATLPTIVDRPFQNFTDVFFFFFFYCSFFFCGGGGGWGWVVVCFCHFVVVIFCHSLKICICFGYDPEILLLTFHTPACRAYVRMLRS